MCLMKNSGCLWDTSVSYVDPVTLQTASRHCFGIFQDFQDEGTRDKDSHTKLAFQTLFGLRYRE